MAIVLNPISLKIKPAKLKLNCKNMKQQMKKEVELNVIPSEKSSEKDFNFLIGKWKIRNRKLNKRLANCGDWTEFEAKQECRHILHGFGNQDFFKAEFDGKPFEGMSLRLFDPKTKLWSIYWADSNAVVLQVPQIGSFENGIGEFFARDNFEERSILVKFNWNATDEKFPVWSQAFSADEGKTWEWNWYMYFSRQS